MTADELTFENAVAMYLAKFDDDGIVAPMLPNKARSNYNARLKRWNLRNVRGLLAFVADSGAVWSFASNREVS